MTFIIFEIALVNITSSGCSRETKTFTQTNRRSREHEDAPVWTTGATRWFVSETQCTDMFKM